jgi:putative transposase
MRRFAGACRFVFNRALALQKERFERGEKSSPKLREKPRPLGRGGIAHRAKRGQTPVDLTLMFLCEYNRQYENRTANQVAPG